MLICHRDYIGKLLRRFKRNVGFVPNRKTALKGRPYLNLLNLPDFFIIFNLVCGQTLAIGSQGVKVINCGNMTIRINTYHYAYKQYAWPNPYDNPPCRGEHTKGTALKLGGSV